MRGPVQKNAALTAFSFGPSFLSYSKYLCAASGAINLTGFISVNSHNTK